MAGTSAWSASPTASAPSACRPRPIADSAAPPEVRGAYCRRSPRDLDRRRRCHAAARAQGRAARAAPSSPSTMATQRPRPARPCRRCKTTPLPIRSKRPATPTSPPTSISVSSPTPPRPPASPPPRWSPQGEFLLRLGIGERAKALARANPRRSRQHRPRRRAPDLARADGHAVQGALRPQPRPQARGFLHERPLHRQQGPRRDERLRHGFFGREGGRSIGDLASNNMSIASGDNPDLVVSNRSSAAYAMGGHGIQRPRRLPPGPFDHASSRLTERPDPAVAIEADAMVTNRPDLLLGILTADCSPDPPRRSRSRHRRRRPCRLEGRRRRHRTGHRRRHGGARRRLPRTSAPPSARPFPAPITRSAPTPPPQIVAARPRRRPPHRHSRRQGPRAFRHSRPSSPTQLLDAGVGLVGDLDICTYADPAALFLPPLRHPPRHHDRPPDLHHRAVR